MADVWGALLETPLGVIGLVAGPEGIRSACLPQKTAGEAKACLEEEGGDPVCWTGEGAPVCLLEGTHWLKGYFAGNLAPFRGEVDLAGLTPFQREVLGLVREIPPGQVLSYGEVARLVGRPKAFRAVGGALRSNPVPYLVPCHRVVLSDGTLGGYSGSMWHPVKAWLLRHEGVELRKNRDEPAGK